MNNKRGVNYPTGVIIVSILLILAGFQVLSFGIMSFILLGFSSGGFWAIGVYLVSLLGLAILIVPTIGLLKRKNWARITTIIIAVGMIIWKITSFIINQISEYSSTMFGGILGMIVPVGIATYMIAYLTSKKAKEFFVAKNLHNSYKDL